MRPNLDIHEVLVLEPDRLCGAVIARTASLVFPSARVYCETDPTTAASMLANHRIELFIVSVRGFDLDILTLLGVWAEHDSQRTRVLVVTPDANSTALQALRSLPIGGVFHLTSGDLQELESACRAVAGGGKYWSSTPAPLVPATASGEKPHIDDPSWIRRVCLRGTPVRMQRRWRN